LGRLGWLGAETGATQSVRRIISHGAGLPRWSAQIIRVVVVDDFGYRSGRHSLDESAADVPGTAKEETRAAFGNPFSAIRARANPGHGHCDQGAFEELSHRHGHACMANVARTPLRSSRKKRRLERGSAARLACKGRTPKFTADDS
jgi:hypothetical protein